MCVHLYLKRLPVLGTPRPPSAGDHSGSWVVVAEPCGPEKRSFEGPQRRLIFSLLVQILPPPTGNEARLPNWAASRPGGFGSDSVSHRLTPNTTRRPLHIGNPQVSADTAETRPAHTLVSRHHDSS